MRDECENKNWNAPAEQASATFPDRWHRRISGRSGGVYAALETLPGGYGHELGAGTASRPDPRERDDTAFGEGHNHVYCFGHCEGVASQQIYVLFMNEGRQPHNILIAYQVAFLP